MRRQFSERKILAFVAASAAACTIWLCGAREAQAQQWTTSANGANNINSTNSGNVGVGTSSPQAKLDVRGSSAYDTGGVFSAVYAKGTADYPMALMLDGAGTIDNVARLRALNNGQTKWQINFADDLTFYSWGSTFNQRFSVTAAGNVVFGSGSAVFSANASRFLLFDAGPGVTDGEIGVGSNQPGSASLVGQYAFVNSNLGATEKRIATIAAATDGATNSGNLQFYTWNAGAAAERARIDRGGNFGIGTTNPGMNGMSNTLTVQGATTRGMLELSTGQADADGLIAGQVGFFSTGNTGGKQIGAILAVTNGAAAGNRGGDLYFLTKPDGGTLRTAMVLSKGGNLGVGPNVTNPTHTLEVGGTIHATGAITGGSIEAKYQDVAEWVPSVQELTPGTVVVLDGARTNHVLASSTAYDTKVAGVVSAQPGVILGVAGDDKVKVATTGRVKVKVDASRGAIKVGDLLVTSGVEGVAMKSMPVDLGGTPIHRPGTIIGKALEPLEKGTGEILVLLSLQ